MPRKKKPVLTYSAVVARLKRPGHEIFDWRVGTSGERIREQRGWRWPCACAAFVHDEPDRCLWIPCGEHDELLREA